MNFDWSLYSSEWPSRILPSVTIHNDELYLVGGRPSSPKAEVWKSADGISWTMLTNNASWGCRNQHKVVTFNNKMWLTGGIDPYNIEYSDVWSSSDGITWTLETNSPGWLKRYGHEFTVFNSKMWIFGGFSSEDGVVYFKDIWSSLDGVNWTLENDNAEWGYRRYHKILKFNDELWLSGGNVGNYYKDVWKTNNGKNWTLVNDNCDWDGRYYHGFTEFNNQMWILGGLTSSGARNDIWSSSNGINWTLETPNTDWSIRYGIESLVFNQELIIVGGRYLATNYAETWKTPIKFYNSNTGVSFGTTNSLII